mmetsp:Transcript_5364/g.9354  ORF Transcript_5364/g.9354 Transcript_5364/m.9354 type:complete len:80 (+) Transcript_5364:167-406(+)
MRLRNGAGLKAYVERAKVEIDESGKTMIEGEGKMVEKVVSVAEIIKRQWQGVRLEQSTQLTKKEGSDIPHLLICLSVSK